MAPRRPQPENGKNVSRKMLGTLTQSERNPAGGFDLYEADVAPLIYCDGVGEVGLGSFIVKLTLYRNDGNVPESFPPIEQRRTVAQLAMPLPNVLQMCNFLLENIQRNAEALQIPLTEMATNLQTLRGVDREKLGALIRDMKKQ
jgi:hypothetical protein